MKNVNKHLNKGMATLSSLFISVAVRLRGRSGRGIQWQRSCQPGRFPQPAPPDRSLRHRPDSGRGGFATGQRAFHEKGSCLDRFRDGDDRRCGGHPGGTTFYPHAHELSEHAKQVLGQHDHWAEWTMFPGGAGAVLQGLNLFFLTDKRWAVGLVAAVLLGAGYSVSRAGHFGSQLVYIEGVGPQGQHLEPEEEGHSH